MVPKITTTELKVVINDLNIIDIRDKEDFCLGHINKAINMPFEKILVNFKISLNKKDTYYIYCDTGKISAKVVQILINEGYKAINVDGGYNKWVKENKIC